MADKEVPLSIVIRTVDKATAGINAVNKRLDAITKPTRDFGKALKELGEKSGFNGVLDGFKEVGGAVKETLFKVAELGLVVGETAHLVLEMVDKFATLGHTAEKIGVTTDFLAAMRFAAQKAGVPIEALDEGLTTFAQNLGQARTGVGRMVKFLSVASPALLAQLKAATSTAAGYRLLADAMAKVTDPAKRLALAQKTLGNSALAPVLAKGSKGLLEQQGAYAGLADSQEEAAKTAMEVEDSMIDLHAVADGLEAKLVQGLGPALKVIIDKLSDWLVGHREDLARWSIEIGEKLPGAIDKLVRWVQDVSAKVATFVDDVGGLKTVLIALAAIMVGPLVSAFVTLGVTMLATPFGAVLASLAAISAMVISVTDEVQKLNDALDTKREIQLQDLAEMTPEQYQAKYPNAKMTFTPSTEAGRRYEARHAELIAQWMARDAAAPYGVGPGSPRNLTIPSLTDLSGPRAQAQVTVDFVNAPPGTRAKAAPQSTVSVDLSMGYQMIGFGGS